MKLGIFGGTFNPIHYGHLRVAEEVRYGCGLDRIIFIPSGSPSLKTAEIADADHRYKMTCMATGSNPDFSVSDIEMHSISKSYTIKTVEKLNGMYPDDELCLIMGVDVFLDLPAWREPERLVSLIDFIIMTRPGFSVKELKSSPFVEALCEAGHGNYHLKGGRTASVIQVTACDIASTTIRQLIREGKSIKYLLPEAVEQYIAASGLYRL
jgi:nicotinate-nucleotide adenylyltransferase